MDGLGHKKSLMITMALAGTASLFFIFTQNIYLLIILLGIFTIGRSGGINVTRAFISTNIAEEIRATGMSINDTFQYLARVIGPLIAGLLIDFTHIFSPFIMCFILALIAIVLLFFEESIFNFLNKKRGVN